MDEVEASRNGEHDREVGFDRLALAVVDPGGLQLTLGHAECLFDLELLVVGADHELRGHGRPVGRGLQVGDVALQPRQCPGPWPPAHG